MAEGKLHLISFNAYTTSNPNTAGGNTRPKYSISSGNGLSPLNTMKGKKRVKTDVVR